MRCLGIRFVGMWGFHKKRKTTNKNMGASVWSFVVKVPTSSVFEQSVLPTSNPSSTILSSKCPSGSKEEQKRNQKKL